VFLLRQGECIVRIPVSPHISGALKLPNPDSHIDKRVFAGVSWRVAINGRCMFPFPAECGMERPSVPLDTNCKPFTDNLHAATLSPRRK
jgi:hypothetical protein